MDFRYGRRVSFVFSLLFVLAIAVLTASPESSAFEAKSQDGRLQDKEFFKEELYISSSNVQVSTAELSQRSGSPALDRMHKAPSNRQKQVASSARMIAKVVPISRACASGVLRWNSKPRGPCELP